MVQLLEATILEIYPQAVKPRSYVYPVNHDRNPWLAMIEWGSGGQARRVAAHYREDKRNGGMQWVGGMPTYKPEGGWSLYGSERWQPLGPVYLVATEREAFGLEAIGLDATTWVDERVQNAKFSDWTSLDGRQVMVWTDPSLHRELSRHLWRHAFVTGKGLPLEWLRSAWERHGGDKAKIWEELWWEPTPPEVLGLAGAGDLV